jgi:hypothetical protein
VADNVAQRLGPCEEKQTVQMVGLGVDFDRENKWELSRPFRPPGGGAR